MKIIAALIAAIGLVACNTIVTETVDPVTGKVTSRTTTTTVDAGAVTAGANTVAIIAASQPKGREVNASK